MSNPQSPPHHFQNRILAALPAADYARLKPHLETVAMKHGEILYRTNRRIEQVYFPLRAMASVVTTTSDGGAIEVGVVGREGMTGLSVVLGVNVSPAELMVQLPDGAVRLPAEVLLEEFQRAGALQTLLLHYTHATLVMVAQTAACNRLHHISERLARWLLMCRDRVVSDELPLTHEFLAMMLGIRRAGVTETALTLQAEGLISYKRGHINITDGAGLEDFACECYSIVKAEFEHLFEAPIR
jgi:CRP-like cAMP-binding protein